MHRDKIHRALAHIAAGADKMAQAAQEVLTPLAGTSKDTRMDNHDRAISVIAHGLKNGDSPARITRHLADYGLLAEDFPEEDLVTEKGTHVWMPKQGFTVTAYHDGEVRMGIPPAYPDTELWEVIYTQPQAIEQALALLAAAAHYAKEEA